MTKNLSTLLELVGIALLIASAAVLLGLGVALLTGGLSSIAIGIALDPPERWRK